MAFPQGINFRSTSGYVADGANEYAQLQPGTGGNYPTTTPQGNTVGWEGTAYLQIGSRDRSTSIDRRLAGTNYANTAAVAMYRIDLPAAGSYNVRLAAGDAQYSASVQVELFDDNASIGVMASGSLSAGSFMDATGATLSSANWPSQNAAITKSFASTTCRIGVGSSAANNKVISHFYIESAGSGSKSVMIVGTGGFAFAGLAVSTRGALRQAQGGLQLAGSAAQARGATRSTSGGLQLGGTAARSRTRAAVGTGALQLSGASAVITNAAKQLLTVVAAGGIAFGGAVARVASAIRTAAGGISFNGSAAYTNSGVVAKAFAIMRRRARPRNFPTSR